MTTLSSASAPPLRDLLRSATANAHSGLEDTLALLRPPLQQGRFVQVLSGFSGFHAAWEPAVAARLQQPGFTAPRERLASLAHDLLALGLSADVLCALPACEAAAGLCSSMDATLGALYVVEGSTLGGKVIGKQLAQVPWCPAGGLRYFDAHGADTGRLWRATLAYIDSHAQDPQHVADGARRAFDVLRNWLGDAPQAAALPSATTSAATQ